MKQMIVAAALALIAAPALAAPVNQPVTAETGAVARLRAQNDVLRERMGQMQLDLLIADVLTRHDAKAGTVARRDLGATAQVVAFRR